MRRIHRPIRWLGLAGLGLLLVALGVHQVAEWRARLAVQEAVTEIEADTTLRVRYAGVSLGWRGRPLTIGDVQVRGLPGGAPWRIERMRIHEWDWRHPVPRRVRLDLTGVRIPEATVPGLDGVLPAPRTAATEPGTRDRGHPIVDLELAYGYDPQAQTLRLDPLRVESPEGLTYRFQARLDTVNLASIVDQPRALQAFAALQAVSRARLVTARLDVREPRRLAPQPPSSASIDAPSPGGADNPPSVADGPSTAQDLRRRAAQAEAAEAQRLARLLTTLADFLEGPDRLRITAEPTEPVPLGRLLRPPPQRPSGLEDLLETFQLEATTGKADPT